MKKIIILTAMNLLFLLGSTSATEFSPAVPNPPGFWIKLEFTFHRPKKDCLTGFGVCADLTVGFDHPVTASDKGYCPVKAQLNDRNQLIVEIAESALTMYENASTLPYFKDKTAVTIPDPYTLSPDACRALGSTVPLTIKAGTYPVTYANATYTVVFQL